jgi:hypothetical protein
VEDSVDIGDDSPRRLDPNTSKHGLKKIGGISPADFMV